MTTTNAAYLVINRTPDNGMDCIDEFDSLTEACNFASEFGGEVVDACDYQPKGLLECWFSGWTEAEARYAG